MIALLSPAKTLDFQRALPPLPVSAPHFAEEAHDLAQAAAEELSEERLGKLMHISPRLAKLNAERFRDFADLPERPALYAFAGDVYTGFEVDTLDEPGVAFAQNHVRMLSGLYGLLRPLDTIRPYRLEIRHYSRFLAWIVHWPLKSDLAQAVRCLPDIAVAEQALVHEVRP